jgi:hypothetical protein
MYKERKTQAQKISYIKNMLSKNDAWVYRGVVAIFKKQTEDERIVRQTKHSNNVGFTGADAEFLSAMAIIAIEGRVFTPNQMRETQKAMIKYAGQLMKIAENMI